MSRLNTKLQTIIKGHFYHFTAGQLRLIKNYRKAVVLSLGVSLSDAEKIYWEHCISFKKLLTRPAEERKEKIYEIVKDQKTYAAISYVDAVSQCQKHPKGLELPLMLAESALETLKEAQEYFKENKK